MKLFRNDVDSINQLVFEKRNRDYGAYAIRESYNGNAIKSTLITSGSFLLLVLLIYSFSGTGKFTEEKNIFDQDQTKVIATTKIDIPEPKVDPPKLQPANAASKAASFVRFNDNADTTNTMKSNDNMGSITGLSNNPDANGTNPYDTGSVALNVPTNTVTADPPRPKEPMLWAEKMPQFNGSMADFIQRNIVFPESAIYGGASGTVIVQFVVDETGAISNVKAAKGIGYGCDEEAVRVVSKMPKWIPGKMGNENVKVLCNLPIKFKVSQ